MENLFAQIIDAINEQDAEKMKNMFSEQAQMDAEKLDGGIEYLFHCLDGEIESWEKVAASEDLTNNYGEKTLQYEYHFQVCTEKEE